MKVSIVIPARNEEERISSVLQTLQSQTYPDVEVIVVDNASTDRTSEIAHGFPNVKVVYEPRPGLLYARERGRIEASGDVIANIDADCLPAEDWVERGVSILESDQRLVAVSGPYDYYDGTPGFRRFSGIVQRMLMVPVNKLLQAFHSGAIIIGGNNMIKAQALRDIGGYDTSIIFYGEDTDTARRISKVGKVAFRSGFAMRTSARRYIRIGMMRTYTLYFLNFVWVLAFKRPFSQDFPKKKKPKASAHTSPL